MVLRLIFLAFFLLPAVASATLCKEGERVYFSCSTEKKIISVCTSEELDNSSSYIQYRFGTAESVELEFPETRIASLEKFTLGEDSYAEGDILHFAFSSGKYEYVIYQALFKNFPSSETDLSNFSPLTKYAGVAVYKSDISQEKPVQVIQCSDRPLFNPLPSGFLKPHKKVFTFPEEYFNMRPFSE